MRSVGVWIDYQNAYNRARECFSGSAGASQAGQFHPMGLGHMLCAMGADRELADVFIYRGQPNPRRDKKGAAACQRQVAAWQVAGANVTTRPLKYDRDGQAEEKGIDVLIALDFAEAAMFRRYDVQVLVSADTDLVPALERAQRMSDMHERKGRGSIELEVVAWMPAGGGARRLKVGGVHARERDLTQAHYAQIEDTRNFAKGL